MNDEIAKVLDELTEFAEQILPAMAAKDPACFPDHVDGSESGWRQRLRTLADWRGAARRLHHILSTISTAEPSHLDAAEFRRFMVSEASPDYAIRDGKIHWQISVFVPMDWTEAVKMSPLPPECQPKGATDTARSIEATKRWMLGASAQDFGLFNPLCMALPCIADVDPAFARSKLDVEAWRDRIRSNPAFTDAERALELAALDGSTLRTVLHNALLHVIAVLANNHFGEIRHLINNPNFTGRYTPLVMHYLFAVLFSKVQILTGQIPLDLN